MGPTSPAVDSGVGAPGAEPLARVTTHPMVFFARPSPFSPGLCVAPLYAGLSPGFVGLYQVNVTIPEGVPAGGEVPLTLAIGGLPANTVTIAVDGGA